MDSRKSFIRGHWLFIEMNHQGLEYEREKKMEIFYRDELIGTRRADFFVEGLIMVKLKANLKLEEFALLQKGETLTPPLKLYFGVFRELPLPFPEKCPGKADA